MDFLGEVLVQAVVFLVQLLIQFVVEAVFQIVVGEAYRGTRRMLRNKTGRSILTVLIGLAFGVLWGAYLRGRPDPPRLLWIAVGVAVASIALISWRADHRPITIAYDRAPLRELFAMPWNWPTRRLADFTALNLAIAAGICVGYFT